MTGAVEGYFVRDEAGRLATSPVGATQERALYSLRVWLDDLSAIPMNDGHFRFEGVAAGVHTVRAEATYGGQVHRAEGTVTVIAGATVAPEVIEVSVESAPELAWHWVTTQNRWGNPTGMYVGASVIGPDGLRPTDPTLQMTVRTNDPTEVWVSEGEPSVGHETRTFDDCFAEATLGGFTITGQALCGGSIPSSLRMKPAVNVEIEPCPVIIGQPATVRWTKGWSATAKPAAGVSLVITDGMYGTTRTLTLRPSPDWFPDVAVYYPRDSWELGAADTAKLKPGVPYVLTVDAADALDPAQIRQRFPSRLTFTAVDPGEVPPPPGTWPQTTLPVVNDALDGFVYYAEAPGPHPIGNELVVVPHPVAHLVPAEGAAVTLGNHITITTGREGHLHLDAMRPGPLPMTVAAENPTTGDFFTQPMTLELVERGAYSPTATEGTVVAYVCHTPGRVWVDRAPGAGPPLLSSRVIVDGPQADPAYLQNVLPQSDGRIQLWLSPGVHSLRFEGITEGKVWTLTTAVGAAAGQTLTLAGDLAPTADAKPLHFLGVQATENFGFDADANIRVRAVTPDGLFRAPQVTPGDTPQLSLVPDKEPTRPLFPMGPSLFAPGEWDFGYYPRQGYFQVWPNRDQYGLPGALLMETEHYGFPLGHAPMDTRVGNVYWIKTYPCPLVAGKPGIVYWGPSPLPGWYRFAVQRANICLDSAVPGDPIRGFTQPSSNRVRVLSRTDTREWLDPTSSFYSPYTLCVYTYDSQWHNCQRQKWLNHVMVQPQEEQQMPTDIDGDEITYEYQWARSIDGGATWMAWGNSGATLPATATAKGDSWKVRARAYDGTDYSPWVESAPVTIGNTPPPPPGQVIISPGSPTSADNLTATVA